MPSRRHNARVEAARSLLSFARVEKAASYRGQGETQRLFRVFKLLLNKRSVTCGELFQMKRDKFVSLLKKELDLVQENIEEEEAKPPYPHRATSDLNERKTLLKGLLKDTVECNPEKVELINKVLKESGDSSSPASQTCDKAVKRKLLEVFNRLFNKISRISADTFIREDIRALLDSIRPEDADFGEMRSQALRMISACNGEKNAVDTTSSDGMERMAAANIRRGNFQVRGPAAFQELDLAGLPS